MVPAEATDGAVAGGALARLAARVERTGGWRGVALAIAAGAVSATALPPWGLVPALLLVCVLVWRLDGCRSVWSAFLAGWGFGFGQLVIGLHWIANAMLVDGDRFLWAIPFAVAGLPAALAVYHGLAAAAFHLLAPRPGLRAPVFAALWTAAEAARGHLFTGFPWNLPGTVWAVSDATMQPAALVGVYGLSFVTMLVAALPAGLAGRSALGARGRAAALSLAIAVPAGLYAYGVWRLATVAPGPVPDAVVRIVQGNIPQAEKWVPELRVGHVARYVQLSRRSEPDARSPDLAPGVGPTVVVWPETAVPFFLNREPRLLEAIAGAAPPGGSLVTGAPFLDAAGDGGSRVYNSLFAIADDGRTLARYDKAHLVPFGEYMPMRDWLPVDKVVGGFNDFSAGPGPVTLAVPGLPPASPLVCYEVIFPGAVVAESGPRPALLLNLTNDAWFGDSAGPVQHLVAARFRAVEEGLPLVRAANTGISASVDSLGRVLVMLKTGKSGTADSQISAPIESGTLYARIRDLPIIVLAISIFVLSAFDAHRRARVESDSRPDEIC